MRYSQQKHKKYHLQAVPKGLNVLLGGGTLVEDGWVNVDLHAPNAIHHDLNKMPYPFKANTVDMIEATNILEHLHDWPACLKECHRILKPGGKLLIQVPHYMSPYMWTHWDHRNAFSVFSFDAFAKDGAGPFVESEPNDMLLKGTQYFSHINRSFLFPKGLWFWGRPLELISNCSPTMQVFWELWLCGILKPSGVLIILTK